MNSKLGFTFHVRFCFLLALIRIIILLGPLLIHSSSTPPSSSSSSSFYTPAIDITSKYVASIFWFNTFYQCALPFLRSFLVCPYNSISLSFLYLRLQFDFNLSTCICSTFVSLCRSLYVLSHTVARMSLHGQTRKERRRDRQTERLKTSI